MSDNKMIIVSGGSRGLGKALIEYLLKEGYAVATFSRSKPDFIQCLLDTPGYGQRFYRECLDARDTSCVKEFVLSVYKRFGRIDGLVNNAGANLDQLLTMTNEEDITNILDLNLKSVILLTKSVTRVMLQQNSGSIVNISSILGLRGFKGTPVYSASKAGLDGFSRSLARELGSRGIRVNSIAPGFLDTDMTGKMPEDKKAQIIRRTPLGRLGRVEDVTGAVEFLLSDRSGFITGQTFGIDGGLTC